MDEISVLKYIFRGEFREDTKIDTFNNRKYDYSNYSTGGRSFYSFILEKEEEIKELKNELIPQFDTQTVDVLKITEEQFNYWKKNKKSIKTELKANGKNIWTELNKRDHGKGEPEEM